MYWQYDYVGSITARAEEDARVASVLTMYGCSTRTPRNITETCQNSRRIESTRETEGTGERAREVQEEGDREQDVMKPPQPLTASI